jgi:uncharacterized membrane protein YdfJ with MMPL/SSD domain
LTTAAATVVAVAGGWQVNLTQLAVCIAIFNFSLLNILIMVFRSLLVPLVATTGFVLSLFAALGGVTAIYQWGWLGSVFGVHDPGPVLNFMPTLLVGILFGLAVCCVVLGGRVFFCPSKSAPAFPGVPSCSILFPGFMSGS